MIFLEGVGLECGVQAYHGWERKMRENSGVEA